MSEHNHVFEDTHPKKYANPRTRIIIEVPEDEGIHPGNEMSDYNPFRIKGFTRVKLEGKELTKRELKELFRDLWNVDWNSENEYHYLKI